MDDIRVCPKCYAAGMAKNGKAASGNRRWRCRHCSYSTTQPIVDNDFDATKPVSDQISVEELVEHRKKLFRRKHGAKKANHLLPVRIKLDGPIAICHFGDPHVDDDGTDIERLEYDAKLVRETEGMFGANVGDITNNWVGRLARLYGEQSTTSEQAWMLAEWFLGMVDWLYVTGGNHDCWSGAGSPIRWILNNCSGIYQDHAVRLNLKFPNGREVRVNARHDFRGHSQWNTAHGAAKAAQMGWRDHILVCGHKHKSGYNIVKDPSTGIWSHCIQVASYKVHDRYAEEAGFMDQTLSPCVVTLIDPDAKQESGLVQVFHDIDLAADYLTYLRGRKTR